MGRETAMVNKAPVLAALASALFLAACGSSNRELPDNSEDKTLKKSPCACAEIEGYDGGGFEWRSS